MKNNKSILVILDGWGIGKHDFTDAIFSANKPFTDQLTLNYPHSKLMACGQAVGLPEGQMGNSEVGHLNIGAGRIVYQMLETINKSIRESQLNSNAVLKEIFEKARTGKTLHLMGLISDGGVHSHIDHLVALCELAAQSGVKKITIHGFLDGRDCDPKSGAGFIEELKNRINQTGANLSTIVGRYYAMDRDNRWERIKKSYDLLIHGNGTLVTDAVASIKEQYENGITDEFMIPMLCVDDLNQPITKVKEGDIFLCFNFRTDRCRQITKALTQEDFPEFGMHKLNLEYYTMTEYDKSFKNIKMLFEEADLKNTLGEVLEKNGLSQLRAAETEKYPHVTFFFSGGREGTFVGEERFMMPSPKIATYDLKPEMSAIELTDGILDKIHNENFDFMAINFANTDMVGHTGVWDAIVKAAETVDTCLGKIVTAGLEKNYSFIIIADHGNADEAKNADGSPNTQHSLNKVPCWLVSNTIRPEKLEDGILADVAPTLLKIMNIEQPSEMNGKALF